MRVLSLFSGAGGLDLGFTMAGHEIVWANDCYSDAVETYRCNLGDHIVCEDVSKIDFSKVPDCDIIIGGFPCQGFSVANTNRNEEDSRNKLYLEMVRAIQTKQPKFFLAENVKGILSLSGGKVFEMILDDFTKLGYTVSYKLLNSANYGVPQKRERVFIVGVRNDVDFEYHFPTQTHSKNGLVENTSKWITVGEALSKYPDPTVENDFFNHECSVYKLNFNGYIGHRPINPDEPAPTVTGRGDERGGVVVLPHPNGKRRMTCRELASVQSFPDSYLFIGSKTSVYRQIGNAVPPLLAKAVAEQFNHYGEDHETCCQNPSSQVNHFHHSNGSGQQGNAQRV